MKFPDKNSKNHRLHWFITLSKLDQPNNASTKVFGLYILSFPHFILALLRIYITCVWMIRRMQRLVWNANFHYEILILFIIFAWIRIFSWRAGNFRTKREKFCFKHVQAFFSYSVYYYYFTIIICYYFIGKLYKLCLWLELSSYVFGFDM